MTDPDRDRDEIPLVEALLRRRGPGFLLLDYDGTLVPIRRRPEEAVADRDVVDLLRRLVALPERRVAVVSGRSLENLATVLPPVPGLWRFGTHGGEGETPEGSRFETVSAAGADVLVPSLSRLLRRVSWPEGAWVETKGTSVVLHYRECGKRAVEAARSEFRAAVAEADPGGRLHLLEGKQVLEAMPDGVDKGSVVRWLRGQRTGRESWFLAVGDDVTDERMFEALGEGDVPVWVGDAEGAPSSARWRLSGPEQVRRVLRELVRGQRTGTPRGGEEEPRR